MKKSIALTSSLLLFLTFNLIQAQSPGDVIVTEVMQDPAFVTDANGEWFEIYNSTASPIDLQGWIMKDNGTNTHTISSSLIIQPASFLLFAVSANTATNG